MLVTFLVVNTSSVFVYKRQITFAKDSFSLKAFIASKYVYINRITKIKIRSKILHQMIYPVLMASP